MAKEYLKRIFKTFFITVCICLFMCMDIYAVVSMWNQRELVEVSSLLLPCGSQGSNSGQSGLAVSAFTC